MDYVLRLADKRAKRDESIEWLRGAFDYVRAEFFFLEAEILLQVAELNLEKFRGSDDLRIGCFLKYNPLTKKFNAAFIDRVRFELFEKTDEIVKRRDLSQEKNWLRIIRRVVPQNMISRYRKKKSDLLSNLRRYYSLSEILNCICQEYLVYEFPVEATEHLPLFSDGEYSHLNKNKLKDGFQRSIRMTEVSNKITYTKKLFSMIESNLDRQVAVFNFKFDQPNRSLIFSWVLLDRQCGIRSIGRIAPYIIRKPIDNRGVRSRHKYRIKKIDRELIRSLYFKRYESACLKLSRKITVLGKEFELLRKLAISTKSTFRKYKYIKVKK